MIALVARGVLTAALTDCPHDDLDASWHGTHGHHARCGDCDTRLNPETGVEL